MFKFNLTYKLKMDYVIMDNDFKRETKEVVLRVKKYGYAKN